MKKISAFIISFILIITAMAPSAFAEVSAAFTFSKSITTDEHYPGQLYEYIFTPDADTDDIIMTFNITSGSNLVQELKFAPKDNVYVLSFYISPTVTTRKEVEFEVTCKDKRISSNKATVSNSFYCGYEDFNYIDYEGSKEFYIDNGLPVYIFNDDVENAKLIFDNESYYEVDIEKSNEKHNLIYNENAVAAIANNTDANLYFMNFLANPSFSDTGTFYLYAPDAEYLYSYNGSTLTKLKATEDDDYIVFTTRTLGNYIASDKPLTDIDISSSSSSSQIVSSSSSSSQIISSSSSQSVSSSSTRASSSSKSQVADSGTKINPGTGIN